MTIDPVCHVDIEERSAGQRKLTSDYDGQTFYFCSVGCKKAFDAKPSEFATQIRWPEDWESHEADWPYSA